MENKLDEILNKLSNLEVSVTSLTVRVESIEKENVSGSRSRPGSTVKNDATTDTVGQLTDNDNFDRQGDIGQASARPIDNNLNLRAPLNVNSEVGPTTEADLTRAADIQRDFERLRDSLLRIPVPNNLKVYDNSTGIKQESRNTLRIISKCARYSETALKVLSMIQDEEAFVDTDKLFTCLAAQINFLQSEYANLVVKNTFDEETSRIFKQFENNTGVFNQSSLQNIRIAADLAKSRSVPQRARGGRVRGFRGQTAFRGNRWDSSFHFRQPMRREFHGESHSDDVRG